MVVGARPLPEHFEPSGTEQSALIAVRIDPNLGGGRETTMRDEAVLVVLDPPLKPGPFAQQNLVRYFDTVLRHGEHALIGEGFDHLPHVVRALDVEDLGEGWVLDVEFPSCRRC
ncbi:hypothetical protein FHU29_001017 [Hoyosella altamirensis]|uniref:Uncharacterized protein n=1 Tax=Hoyosella altamirensis TaxID=616997 RepID=A0A839RKI4_9ACTN|nr:hypothetical protein [Hoyosella altamirensis]MBB3036583.1 hypothetical protein [Hoyosella altamirensis]